MRDNIEFNFNTPPQLREDDPTVFSPALSKIVDNLFLVNSTGSAPYYPLLINGQPDTDKKSIAILKCTNNVFNPNFVGSQEAELINRFLNSPQNNNFKQIAVGDAPGKITVKHLEEAYQFIENALNNGRKVIVHCDAGASRSATFVIYYIMKKFNLSFVQANNHVRNQRPIVNVSNFEDVLKSLDATNSLGQLPQEHLQTDSFNFYLSCLLVIGIGASLFALGIFMLMFSSGMLGISIVAATAGGTIFFSGIGVSLYQFFSADGNGLVESNMPHAQRACLNPS